MINMVKDNGLNPQVLKELEFMEHNPSLLFDK